MKALRELSPQTIEYEEANGKCSASAQIQPGLGANLVSLSIDGTELIYWNQEAFLSEGTFSGAFNMFPSPCRLAGSSYVFEGRKIKQRKHGKDIFLHGLIRDEPMEFTNHGRSITSWIDVQPGHPVYEGFPFKCRFTIKHELGVRCFGARELSQKAAYLTVRFRLDNLDKRNIPFGYGIHPYWRILGGRQNVCLRIPCGHVMELRDLIPTGELLSVDGTTLDLRTAKSIENLELDNVYWGQRAADSVDVIFKSLQRRLCIQASALFSHVVAYTPLGQPYFCVENLTSSPNAQNIVDPMNKRAAHLLVAPPGRSVVGWVRYAFLKE